MGTAYGSDTVDLISARLTAALAAEPGLESRAARQLLLRRVCRRLDRPLYVVEYDIGYQWFVALVQMLAAESGGFSALSAAVEDLQPRSRLAATVADLAGTAASVGPGAGSCISCGAADAVSTAAEDPGGPGSSGGHPSAAVDGGAPESLRDGESREFARVFGRGAVAMRVLRDAGLPSERIPSIEGDAETFWVEISRLLGHGLLIDGRRRVLAAAAARFPANAVFAAGLL
ncbi:effector-associated domain EAD1-containing protein [Parafrankia sp. EUN1f]|uniref:effector-associated domain 2-containing protein n=1 Tax=Parafrankia sp. EUN1f TaxID=102897 RepID=UPI0001C45FB0|nr:effector-associated domain EAD1-containing protein [Parafrankia sp. EUN1f]EFC81423.1 hypothetical protein FrEUN1fDRAFT_5475 [Parafrankia sp. EUN1f]